MTGTQAIELLLIGFILGVLTTLGLWALVVEFRRD